MAGQSTWSMPLVALVVRRTSIWKERAYLVDWRQLTLTGESLLWPDHSPPRRRRSRPLQSSPEIGAPVSILLSSFCRALTSPSWSGRPPTLLVFYRSRPSGMSRPICGSFLPIGLVSQSWSPVHTGMFEPVSSTPGRVWQIGNRCLFWVSNRTPSAHSEWHVCDKHLGQLASVLGTHARMFSAFPVHYKHLQTIRNCHSSRNSPSARDASCSSDWESPISLRHACDSNGYPQTGVCTLLSRTRRNEASSRVRVFFHSSNRGVIRSHSAPDFPACALCQLLLTTTGPLHPTPPNVSNSLDRLVGPLLSPPPRSQPPPCPVRCLLAAPLRATRASQLDSPSLLHHVPLDTRLRWVILPPPGCSLPRVWQPADVPSAVGLTTPRSRRTWCADLLLTRVRWCACWMCRARWAPPWPSSGASPSRSCSVRTFVTPPSRPSLTTTSRTTAMLGLAFPDARFAFGWRRGQRVVCPRLSALALWSPWVSAIGSRAGPGMSPGAGSSWRCSPECRDRLSLGVSCALCALALTSGQARPRSQPAHPWTRWTVGHSASLFPRWARPSAQTRRARLTNTTVILAADRRVRPGVHGRQATMPARGQQPRAPSRPQLRVVEYWQRRCQARAQPNGSRSSPQLTVLAFFKS